MRNECRFQPQLLLLLLLLLLLQRLHCQGRNSQSGNILAIKEGPKRVALHKHINHIPILYNHPDAITHASHTCEGLWMRQVSWPPVRCWDVRRLLGLCQPCSPTSTPIR
jgi:hypothetical protein